jgi:hypothetical protein
MAWRTRLAVIGAALTLGGLAIVPAPASAEITYLVGETTTKWYGANNVAHTGKTWMNIDRTNHVIRGYSSDEQFDPHGTGPNYVQLRAMLFKNGYGQSTFRWSFGREFYLQASTEPTTPCGGGHGFRAQYYAESNDGGYHRTETLYSGLAQTACT